MSSLSQIKAAMSKPDFKQERLLPLFPNLAHYELTELHDFPALKIFLTNLPADTSPLPRKITISGQKLRIEYADISTRK